MSNAARFSLCGFAAIGALGAQIHCGGGGGGGGANTAPPIPSISSFVANPTTLRVGGTAQLLAIFANGTGLITPGNLSATSGKLLTINPITTINYTLTVTGSTGSSVAETAGVTVVPAGTAVTSPNSVEASGVQQATAGGTFSNGPVLGEPVPATVTSNSSNSIQVRNGFLPPVP